MNRRLLLGLFSTFLLTFAGLCSEAKPDFSGTWRQSNEQCIPKRTGEVTRRIDHRGSDLVVETNVVRGSGPPRHAVQRYSIHGGTSISKGTDGDEFHTSIDWKEESLTFSIEEHEEGRILFSRETWTLPADGSALKVERDDLDATGKEIRKQTLVFLRQPPPVAARRVGLQH